MKNITDKEAVKKVITEINPDAVIHCAAWTAVDMAEDDDKVEKVRGMEMIFVTTAKTDAEARELLKLLGMPFAN